MLYNKSLHKSFDTVSLDLKSQWEIWNKNLPSYIQKWRRWRYNKIFYDGEIVKTRNLDNATISMILWFSLIGMMTSQQKKMKKNETNKDNEKEK